jgi:hypothetical protein
MGSLPELWDGHVTLEVECLDRLYLNGYIGPLATSGGLVTFMREQLGKPIPSPVVLGQLTEKFREAVKTMVERERIPLYQFDHKERKDDVANDFRRKGGTRDGVVFVGVAQEKAQAFQGKKIDGQFWFTRDKTVYVNHYYFYIDDADFGPLFLKAQSVQLRALVRQAVSERARMGQASTGEEGDCLRRAGQWLLVVRRAGAVAAALRFARAGGHRSGIPEVAGADTFAVTAGRS